MKMRAIQYHIIFRLPQSWAIKRTGKRRASRAFSLLKEAIVAGTELSSRNNCKLVVHKKDGTISRVVEPGQDPFPPRG